MIRIRDKRGNVLTENVIFIVLNLVFITILLTFLFTKTESAAVLEEKYAKQIALMIDAAEPSMRIDIDMQDAIKIAEKENFPPNDIVQINGNIVTVKLRENGGYSYSFFNDVSPDPNLAQNGEGYYISIE